MRFVVTLLIGLLLMILEGVFLAVFQIDSIALQIPLALAIFAARDRNLTTGCWLLSLWILPAYSLTLISNYQILVALLLSFSFCAFISHVFPTEHRIFQVFGNVVVVLLNQAVIIFFSLLLSMNPSLGLAALSTTPAALVATTAAAFLLRSLFHYIDERYFDRPNWASYD